MFTVLKLFQLLKYILIFLKIAISGGESCDYTEVFTCYADMLSMVSLTPAMLSTLTPGSLSKIYSIKDMILLDTSKCPTQR